MVKLLSFIIIYSRLAYLELHLTLQMPDNAKVFIKYGPYEAVGIVEYRDSRLQGLKGEILLPSFPVLMTLGIREKSIKR